MKKILVPIDGSPNSLEALKTAKDMADKYGSQIILVSVQKPATYERSIPVDENPDILKGYAKEVIDKGMEVLKDSSVNVKSEAIIGDPAEQILYMVDREDADIVVMGSHGATGMRRFLIGSVSNKVLQHSPKPVMIVK